MRSIMDLNIGQVSIDCPGPRQSSINIPIPGLRTISKPFPTCPLEVVNESLRPDMITNEVLHAAKEQYGDVAFEQRG
jgi:hypothetical protein